VRSGWVIDDRRHYLRHPSTVWVTTADRLLIVEADGSCRVLHTAAVDGWSTLLQDLTRPMAGRA